MVTDRETDPELRPKGGAPRLAALGWLGAAAVAAALAVAALIWFWPGPGGGRPTDPNLRADELNPIEKAP